MACDGAREAISARIDGEDPGCPEGAIEAHLARCGACRDWQQRAHALTRRTRLGGPFLDHDLAGGVLAVAPAPPPGRPRPILRAGLVAVALAGAVRRRRPPRPPDGGPGHPARAFSRDTRPDGSGSGGGKEAVA